MDYPALTVRVLTFNTAVGNRKITTRQQDLLSLPFYREVIEGAPGAPILALQEVGPEQATALKAARAGGRFELVHVQRPGQGNALLIPARYAVKRRCSRPFVGSQLRALARALGRTVTRRERLDVRQYLELRFWSRAQLADRESGLELTVFNTHLSGEGPLRLAQARALARRVHRERARRPVILAGDLNVRAGARAGPDAAVLDLLAPLQDMAPAAVDKRRPAIDWILASGFEPVAARLHTDDAISLPGSPTAELVSDHYAKEAVMVPRAIVVATSGTPGR